MSTCVVYYLAPPALGSTQYSTLCNPIHHSPYPPPTAFSRSLNVHSKKLWPDALSIPSYLPPYWLSVTESERSQQAVLRTPGLGISIPGWRLSQAVATMRFQVLRFTPSGIVPSDT